MSPRERVLTALDGGMPDRIPCALAFYPVRLERLVPQSLRRGNPVDVHFVEMPLSREEKALAERVEKLSYNTRLGSPGQVLTYRRWGYHPESPDERNPLMHARTLDDLREFP
ncbi:unnamed protein product, partial [marine sediment metagenome]